MRWSEADLAAYTARRLGGKAAGRDEPEAQFQARVIRLAKEQSWLVYHTRDSRGSTEGFPDLVLVRDAILFAELKTRTGKCTVEQDRWLTMLSLTSSRVEVYCWRPADFPVIEARLTRRWRDAP